MNPKIPLFMNRVLIPFDSLTEDPAKLIYIQRVPRSYWRRRFYCQQYGVARGLMWWDERVPSLNAPLPPHLANDMTVRAEGEVGVPVEGNYLFRPGTRPMSSTYPLTRNRYLASGQGTAPRSRVAGRST